jgi:hypothetical protein
MSDNSWLHRSNDWGGQAHVDKYNRDALGNVVSTSHGHSPTLNPPVRDAYGNIRLQSSRDLPAPWGTIPR